LRRFESKHITLLNSLEFIPCSSAEWTSPGRAFFAPKDGVGRYQGLFVYVKFSSAASAFLRAVGVREEPHPSDLAHEICTPGAAESFVATSGWPSYLQLLRTLALQWNLVDERARRRLAVSSCLVGEQPRAESELEKRSFQLATASDLVLVDNTSLQQLFHPLSSPQEELLETMYESLGTKWLSVQVSEQCLPQFSGTGNSPAAASLCERIQERMPLVLYRRTLKELVPDARQVASALNVVEVKAIKRVLRFRSESRALTTTACFVSKVGSEVQAGWTKMFVSRAKDQKQTSDGDRRDSTLLITATFDYIDIGTAVSSRILRRSSMSDALLCATIFESSMESLRAKGFPVNRLIAPKALPQLSPGQSQPPAADRDVLARSLSSEPNTSQQLRKSKTQAPSAESRSRSKPQSAKSKSWWSLLNQKKHPSETEMPKGKARSNASRVEQRHVRREERPQTSRGWAPREQAEVRNWVDNCRPNSLNRIQSAARTTPYVLDDCNPPQNLIAFNETFAGLRCFVEPGQIERLRSASGQAAANPLGSIITDLAGNVFALSEDVLHLYWHEPITTIAFNANGALHFNIAVHAVATGTDQGYGVPTSGNQERRKSAIIYWLGVIIHEIAHNARMPQRSARPHPSLYSMAESNQSRKARSYASCFEWFRD
jgi:hypothetical protein